ncbi:unnamed protein product [marine sediment metagenome]|uniref:CoA-binding domain-containing protein n=1 Tax=marine sediment metagenome TaxID=412755 RepID=X0SLJ4_9ZZZZ
MAEIGAVFMFVSPGADPEKHRAIISANPKSALLVVGVKDYEQAEKVSKELADQGVKAIELCAGFGNIGTARVAQAVGGRIPVGMVRFDHHPLIEGHKSGDDIFIK